MMFSYEKLDVYRLSIDFVAFSERIKGHIPRGNSDLRDQLRRAALSIPLNIAEGTGKTGERDQRRFYAIARGSTTECAATLDVCQVLGFLGEDSVAEGKRMLDRLYAMLTKMSRC